MHGDEVLITAAGPIAQEPSWIITTLVGAVLGAATPYLVSLLRYSVHRLRPHPLCASWFTYHFTFHEGDLVMRTGVFEIVRGLRARLVVRAENFVLDEHLNTLTTKLLYRGTMSQEGDHYIMDLHGTSHKERLVIRFVRRIPSNDSTIPGIWLAYDHDGHVAAGVQLLSRTILDDETAKSHLKTWVSVDGHLGAMRIRNSRRTTP